MTEIKVLTLDRLISMSIDEKIQAFRNGYHLEDSPLLESLSYRNIHGKTIHDGTTVDSGAALGSAGQIPVHGSSQHTGTIGDHQGNLTGIGTYTHTAIDSHIPATSAHGTSSAIVGSTDSQTLTNKTITDSTNNVMAKSLKSATTTVDISAATAPTVGQVLTATGSSAATWQSPTGGPSPATSVVSETSYSQSTAVGTSTNYARQDHTHGTPNDLPFEHIINKNQPSGYAGLNPNGLLWPLQIYPIIEEYSNHLGTTDNFTQTSLSGSGSFTADTTNHMMTLTTGTTAGTDYAVFESKKTWVLGANPIIVNFLIQNISGGSGGSGKRAIFGLHDNFTAFSNNGIVISQDNNGAWAWYVLNSGMIQSSGAISPVSNGDLFSIQATSSKASFYQNGTLLGTGSTSLPTAAMYLGASVVGTGPTTARTLSIDFMSIKVHK